MLIINQKKMEKPKMKKRINLKYSITIIIASIILFNSCYSINENRIAKEKEIISNSEKLEEQYTVELNNEQENIVAKVVGKKTPKREVRVKYLIDRSASFKENPSCVEKWNVLCIFPLFLEAPTLIWRTWNSEVTEIETETLSDKTSVFSVDDFNLNICGKKYIIGNGKSIIPSDSCKEESNKIQLIGSKGEIIEPTLFAPDLPSLIQKIKIEKEEAKREKELYSRPHHWLYCSTTGYSNVHPSVTREFLKSFKLTAYEDSKQCEDAAWGKNQIAMQMGIGCVCKYMSIDKSQAEKLNNR